MTAAIDPLSPDSVADAAGPAALMRLPRPAPALPHAPEMLFLDTEFRKAADDGELLSIGIVGDSCEFYAELDEHGVASVLRGHRRNRFLQQEVLPQFGRVSGSRHTLDGMAQAAARWLASRDGLMHLHERAHPAPN